MKKMKYIISAGLIILLSCASNPTVRDDVKLALNDRVSVGNEEFRKGNFNTAELFFKEALRDAYSIDDIHSQIMILVSLGEVSLAKNDIEKAADRIHLAKEIAEGSSVKKHDFILNIGIGKLLIRGGNHDSARNHYYKALKTAGDNKQKAVAYNNLGIVYSRDESGRYDRALEYLEKAVRINSRGPVYNQLADNYYNLGNVYFRIEEWKSAMKYYKKALEADRISENSHGIIKDLRRLAETSLRSGDKENALFYYERALRTAEALRLPDYTAELRSEIARIRKEMEN